MFDTVRLNARGLATRCESACCTVRGACPSAFSTRSAPSGWPPRLRLPICSITRARRRNGSGSSHGRSTNTNEIWFPSWPAPFSPRTFTGTIVFRRTGRSPRLSRNSRTAPATTASTTSLTVAPKRLLIRRRSASGRRARARCRRGEIGSFKHVLGAAARNESASARALGNASPARPAIRRGCSARSSGERTSPSASPARSAIASTSRVTASGVRAGSQPSGSEGATSGVGSTSSEASSTAAMPSTIAWWAFPITPTRPSGSSSAIHSSQSGRSRSSCSDITWSTSSPRSAEPLWCTWRSTANSPSSTHTGSWIESGTGASFCR